MRLLFIEFNTDTIVRQCRVGTRDRILAAIFVFEQITGTEEEEECAENKHERCQVQSVRKTFELDVVVFAIFRESARYLWMKSALVSIMTLATYASRQQLTAPTMKGLVASPRICDIKI